MIGDQYILEDVGGERVRRGRRTWTIAIMSCLVSWPVATTADTDGIQVGVDAGVHGADLTETAQVRPGLERGHPIDQVLAPNETYTYTVEFGLGQYVQLAVVPQDVDVVLTITDPHDHQILRKASPYGAQGPLDACFVAKSAGSYEISVTTTDNNAHSGGYQIRLENVRAATPKDGIRVEAEAALALAQVLREQGTIDSRRQAINKYAEALPLLKSAGDRLAEAQALEQMGGLHNDLGENQKAGSLLRQSLQLFQSVRDRRGEGMATSDLGSLENDLGDNKKALAQLTRALAIRKEVGDRRGEAETLEYIGDVYENTSKVDKALENYNAALSLRRSVGDRGGEAQSLDGIGIIHQDIDEEQTALDYFSQALPLHQSLHDAWGEALTLNNFGVSYDSLGEKKKALDYFAKTLPLKRAVGNRRGEAHTLSNMCSAESTLGEWQSAIDHCNAALAITREIGDRQEESAALTKIGLLYVTLGETQNALRQFEMALALARATGDRLWEATVLNNTGLVLYESGEFAKALANYNLALPLRRAVRDRTGEAATLSNIGRSYEAQGKNSVALDCFSRALQIARAAANPRWQAGSLSNMGSLYAMQGEQKRALEHYSQALPLYRNMGDQAGEASVLYGIARVERDLGDFTTALTQIESALKIVETLRGKVANQQLRASYFSSVREYYEFYIDLLMQLDMKDLSKGYAARALEASERSKARSLLETLQEAKADIRHGVDPRLLEREHSLQQLLDGKTERQMRLIGHNDLQAAAVKKEIEKLLAEYQEVEAQLRATSLGYAGLTQSQPFDLPEIQKQVLDADTVLLEYSLGSERSYLWAVTTDSVVGFRLPKRAKIDAAARRVYDLLTARNRSKKGENKQQRSARLRRAGSEYPEANSTLSAMVLGPAAELIRGKRLAIVADGALQYIPFGTLPVPIGRQSGIRGNPLVVDHEIVYLPSASVLGLSRRSLADRKSAPKAVAVLADPVFDVGDTRVKSKGRNLIPRDGATRRAKADASSLEASLTESRLTRSVAEVGMLGKEEYLPRLVFTRQEARSILAVTPAEQGLEALDFSASRAMATSPELGQYRMIHFATHGSLDSEHPELSGLVLSLVDEQGRAVNGFLDLEDVYNLNLSADLVTLSACETGLGKEIKGEGLVGLTRGFMYAGARRVVASLWKVDDVATAELMGRFYEGMLQEGLRPTRALRLAQMQMRNQKRWNDPYYWAAFAIQGEWK